MTIDSLKQLEQLIKLCRKQGITSIKVDDIELQLGLVPPKAIHSKPYLEDPIANLQVPEPNIQDPLAYARVAAEKAKRDIEDYIKTDEPTQEQMLMWSSPVEPGHETQ